ncbi:hypothetical protein X895_4495 [Burkholderia pseudomallei MSHR4503]|nr:hypothetical protein X895_4495 [Burkholderia pseudomallei MSHR4503]
MICVAPEIAAARRRFGHAAPICRLPAAGCRLPAIGYRLSAIGYRLSVTGYRRMRTA